MHSSLPVGITPNLESQSLAERTAVSAPVYVHTSVYHDRTKPEFFLCAIRLEDKELWRFDKSDAGDLRLLQVEGPSIWWKGSLVQLGDRGTGWVF
jgi:hypothetical protein